MPELPWRPPPPRWVLFLREHSAERNVSLLARYVVMLTVIIVMFSIVFHVVMRIEGQQQAWWVGPYWAVSTMTTLGLGDIVLTSLAGRLLTTVVVLTGIIFMLVLLPLVLIQFPPWVEARTAARVRRQLPREWNGHVLITSYDPVAAELIRKLVQYGHSYALIVPDVSGAVRFKDQGLQVMLGELDHPDTWRRAQVGEAALVVATDTDIRNPNAVFTARGVAPNVPIVAVAKRPEAVDALELAGCSHVLQLADMLGRSLARRVIASDALTHEIGRFDELVIAEATASHTPLVGKTLAETGLSELVEAVVVGVWERGEFHLAWPETPIGPHTTLVLAGTRAQLDEYDALFAIYNVSGDPVVVLGGGVVGQATARALEQRGIDCRIVDRKPHVLRDGRGVQGDAADIEVLERAGILKAPAAVTTTHDDDTNVFLALYCRRLRPDMQIISRATYEKNVETLHRAGADFVVSLTSMGANTIFNVLERGEVVTVSEGLNLFKLAVPADLVGRPLAETGLREDTGCSVVALMGAEGLRIGPPAHEPLPADADLVLIGTREAEQRFLQRFAR